MKIYGLDIDLEEPEEGSMVMDVMVIAREVSFDEDGLAQDATLISCTRSTTKILQQGMLADTNMILAAPHEE